MERRLDQVIEAAVRFHADQARDGNDPLPYITHPIQVLILLREVGEVTDEEMHCAAVLHDVLEEGGATAADIERLAGPRVRSLVVELTREEPTAARTAGMSADEVWALRAGMLVDEIAKMSSDAQRIKLADRLANIREAKRVKSPRKLARYLRQTRAILDVVPRKVNPGLWDAIQREL